MSQLLQQAVTAHQTGQLDEAEKLYRSVLAVTPDHPDATALLGLVRGAKGAIDEAVDLIEKAIKRDQKSALFKLHLGNVLMSAKRFSEAVVAFRQAVVLQPKMPEAHYNLANALRAAGDWAGALESYEKAIKYNPSYAEAYNNLALTLVHEKKYDEALVAAKQAVVIAPNYGDGWLTLCNIAEQVKDYPLAIEAGENNIRLLPQNHRAWFGYGVALNRMDRHEEAIAAYKRALDLNPERADIWDNLGQTYQSLNRLEEAEAIFRKTVEIAGQAIPDEATRRVEEQEYGNRHWHLALMELLRGKYKPGFARYRARFKDVNGMQRPKFVKPIWQGEDLKGKTILVCDEQGFGDTLMLCRYLPLMRQRGARVIFSVHPVLEALFKGWPGADEIIVHGTPVSGHDYVAMTFDLPYAFGSTLETLPAAVPYLPVFEADDATRLESDGRPQIGVVWGGSPLHLNDSRRSIQLKVFGGIFSESSFQFYSLNRDMKVGDEALLAQYPLTNLVPRFKNFADAARIIGQLDLVITCDTATAHLAGGLGKPVWVLLPFAPDWRWLTDREDSPWYPNARLFRQTKIGDWADVIQRVRQALRTL